MRFELNTMPRITNMMMFMPIIILILILIRTNMATTRGVMAHHRESTSVVHRDQSGVVAPVPSLHIDIRATTYYRLKNKSRTSSFLVVAGNILWRIYKPLEIRVVWSITLCPLDKYIPITTRSMNNKKQQKQKGRHLLKRLRIA